MDGVKNVSMKGATANHASSLDHHRIQKSTTLNRKFVRKPVAKARINIAAGAASQSLRMQQQGRQQSRQIKQQQQQRMAQQQQRAQQQQQGQQQYVVQQQQGQAKAQAQQQQRIQARAQVMGANRGQQQKRGLLQKRATVRLQPVAAAQQQQTQQQVQQQQVQKATARQQSKQIAVEKQQAQDQDRGVQRNHIVQVAKARQAARKAEPEHLSAQQLKERAIQQALRKVGQVQDGDTVIATQFSESKQQKKHFWQKRRFAIASVMAVISIALLGYLVYLNMPDISVRVAAMQTGIDKAYPSYIPADYRLDGLVKEEAGRITMNFKNSEGQKFTLEEEKSSWDSAAVLSNYVRSNWGSDYSIAKGQGLTIYVSKSNAAWVNGGVFYVITDESGSLSSTDLHDIAVSL